MSIGREADDDRLWRLATVRFLDIEDHRPWQEIEREWLERAGAAVAAGHPFHLARVADVCASLGQPPPSWFVRALHVELHRLAIPKLAGGRHANPLRRAAQSVADVIALNAVHQLVTTDAWLRELDVRSTAPRGEDVYDRAELYLGTRGEFPRSFRELTGETSPARHVSKRDALEKMAARAATRLQRPGYRAFVGANFAPGLLDRLLAFRRARARKKPP